MGRSPGHGHLKQGLVANVCGTGAAVQGAAQAIGTPVGAVARGVAD
jgi:hypothetical protein